MPGSADSTLKGLPGFAPIVDGFVAKLDANLSSGLQIINDKVSFVVQSTSLDPTSAFPDHPFGIFTATALLTNKSTLVIREPIKAVVKTLTNGNKLLSATESDRRCQAASRRLMPELMIPSCRTNRPLSSSGLDWRTVAASSSLWMYWGQFSDSDE